MEKRPSVPMQTFILQQSLLYMIGLNVWVLNANCIFIAVIHYMYLLLSFIFTGSNSFRIVTVCPARNHKATDVEIFGMSCTSWKQLYSFQFSNAAGVHNRVSQ